MISIIGGVVGIGMFAIALACGVGLVAVGGWYLTEYTAPSLAVAAIMGVYLYGALRRWHSARLLERNNLIMAERAKVERAEAVQAEIAALNERYGVPGAVKVRRTSLD